MTPFGRALRRARQKAEWSQEKLAWRLDVTQATVSYWERGVEYPSFKHLAGLASLVPEILRFVHEEELDLLRRLMRAEREAFAGGCACRGCCG